MEIAHGISKMKMLTGKEKRRQKRESRNAPPRPPQKISYTFITQIVSGGHEFDEQSGRRSSRLDKMLVFLWFCKLRRNIDVPFIKG